MKVAHTEREKIAGNADCKPFKGRGDQFRSAHDDIEQRVRRIVRCSCDRRGVRPRAQCNWKLEAGTVGNKRQRIGARDVDRRHHQFQREEQPSFRVAPVTDRPEVRDCGDVPVFGCAESRRVIDDACQRKSAVEVGDGGHACLRAVEDFHGHARESSEGRVIDRPSDQLPCGWTRRRLRWVAGRIDRAGRCRR